MPTSSRLASQLPSVASAASVEAASAASASASLDASAAASRGVVSPSSTPAWSPGSTPLPVGVASEHAVTMAAVSNITKANVRSTRSRVAQLGAGMAVLLGALAVNGCASSDGAGIGEGPTSRVISSVIACKADSDCETGEMCGSGFCQMRRCSDLYTSVPPMGNVGYAYLDRALVVGGASAGLDVYSKYEKGGSKVTATGAPLDVAGGNLTGSRPETLAYINSNSNAVSVIVDGKVKKLETGFQPAHLASGDTDGDGIAELVAVGASNYALCSATSGLCKPGTVNGTPDDVALGDLNGDGADEILFVSNHTLTIVDVAAGKVSTQPLVPTIAHITAGDLDGDGKDELIGTEVGGWTANDKLFVFSMVGASLAAAAELKMDFNSTGALDLVYTRQDDKPVVAVLAAETQLRTFTFANNAITQAGSTTLKAAGKTIAAADLNGRSPSLKLKGDPRVVAGPVVPTTVITLPPYSAAHSAGSSNASLGQNENTSTGEGSSESHNSSVSLGVGVGVSASLGVWGANVGANVSRSISRGWSRSRGSSEGISIGRSYSINAKPELRGYQSGAVVLAGACFHRYDYTVEDPSNLLAEKDKVSDTFTIDLPVGGETTLWSTNRYNALADAMADGRLPKIEIPYKMGDVQSYPTAPTTLDGKPISAEDNVFPNSPVIKTTDVAAPGFSLTTNKSETNGAATSFGMGQSMSISGGVKTGFKLFGIGVDVNVNASRGQDESVGLDKSYNLSTGSSTTFGGGVESVPDLPSTPEDESSLYGYSFRPIVYRHHYTMKDGTAGALYVMTYTVGE